MSKKRAVVFDMDGVIIDSERLIMDLMVEIGEGRGLTGVEKVAKSCLGVRKEVERQIYLDAYGEDLDIDGMHEELRVRYWEAAESGDLPLKPGIRELLNYLKENGWLIALASSSHEDTIMKELKMFEIIDYFDAIVCGSMVKNSKPDPEIYLTACAKLGVRPEEAFAVEDSDNGIRSASRAGMSPIMVPDLLEPTDELRELSVAILPSLFEVIDYLNQ